MKKLLPALLILPMFSTTILADSALDGDNNLDGNSTTKVTSERYDFNLLVKKVSSNTQGIAIANRKIGGNANAIGATNNKVINNKNNIKKLDIDNKQVVEEICASSIENALIWARLTAIEIKLNKLIKSKNQN
ncbi:hypothetical protein BAZOLSSOX_2507 [uncultured Gammaproteobacteria bacterium]|jgi:hypothetical protein|nr:hypothetical protein [uncultured Gammaproteobacteria bacterium]SCN46579.1 hypothetical protein BAZMOX_204940_0 [methanotrophic endosymbiont of Bathymodiolus azoricus (Menez Gwen)]VVH60752.1 hypothetical protein BAZOLSSOX_2507 [uncultured Gammaproteobacteria bacterium]